MRLDPLPSESLCAHVERLRLEAGWAGVKDGLGKILIGYLILLVGSILAGAFIGVILADLMHAAEARTGQLAAIWALYSTIAILGLIQLAGYVTILRGKWACLLNSPDRSGARWLMFGCVICIVMGPTLNLMCWFGVGSRIVRLQDLLSVYGILNLTGIGLSVTSSFLFILFLRAVVSCFGCTGTVEHLNLFLLVNGMVVGGTLVVLFTSGDLLMKAGMLLGLLACAVLIFFWYLFLLSKVYLQIGTLLSQLRSPLDM
jgi:hypothetical protein